MKLNQKHGKVAFVLTAVAVATAVIAGTLIQLDPPVVVSTDDTANNAFKAKMGWISYKSDPEQAQYDVKAQLLVYADGPAGKQDIWIARSVDNGATWVQQKVTKNGGAALTGNATGFFATNNKPNIYVAPTGMMNAGKGANALMTWTSTDCGSASESQRINGNLLTGPQPFLCLWAARSTDGGVTWANQRLTDGSLDPDEDVPAGFLRPDASGGFAISFQADPAGLQQGDAEGPGDGASGARVSAGTNIWYTALDKGAFEAGTPFPAPKQVSDNNTAADGAPGASRANLSISGGTAVLAYEETKGDGSTGKHIVYHSFPYGHAAAPTNNAGTVVSDSTKNARRVRFMLQGNDAIADADLDGDATDGDTKGVHVALLWRETASLEPDAPSDIIMRLGTKNSTARPCDPAPNAGLCGFRASDVLANPTRNLSDTGPADSALAHRGVLRGEFLAVAYDHTPDKAAADAFTATYNLFVKRSTDGGDTWGAARNITNLPNATTRVVEPRMVGTPGTIKLPGSVATNDVSDVQDRNVFYVGWGTETNEAVAKPLDIYITRTTDLGENYERVQLLAEGATEQSEAQLRAPPDGKTLGALWMQRDVVTGTTDVVYRNGSQTTVPDPNLNLTASGTSFAAGAQGKVMFTVLNKGVGNAKNVVLSGSVPAGLALAGVGDANLCTINGSAFSCTVPELLASQSLALEVTLGSSAAGSYNLAAEASGDVVDADVSDNTTTVAVAVTPAAATNNGGGGGCTATTGNAPLDPALPVLAALGLIGLGMRRMRRQ